MGIILCTHPFHGELHNQRHANQEVASLADEHVLLSYDLGGWNFSHVEARPWKVTGVIILPNVLFLTLAVLCVLTRKTTWMPGHFEKFTYFC